MLSDFSAFLDIPTYDYTAGNLVTDFLHVVSHGTKDVVIITDGSAAVTSGAFEDAKIALKYLVKSENQNGGDTKYAAITISDTATQLNFPFLPCDEASDKLEKIPYPDDSKNDQSAFTQAKKLFDDPSSG